MSALAAILVLALAIPVLLLVALVKIADLTRRVQALEARLARPVSQPPAPAAAATPAPKPTSEPAPEAAIVRTAPSPATPPPATPPPSFDRVPRPGMIERALRRGFTEGNVPVKVGMLVLFAGVAALLKYAADQGWLQLPIALRLAGLAACALAALAFGWWQRQQRPSFALSLQGGAIGVLLLIVFAAFKLYALLPAAPAFALSVLLVAACGALAVTQNALPLAVLGILAGFLAPIWLSDGRGNHVALFSYYAVLNAGIFGIAWKRAWRLLNLLGFAFTFGIGTAWGALRYRAADFATTEPFLLLFFAFYLAIPILYGRRQAPDWRDRIDGSLIFGTPLFAFALQAQLLDHARLPLTASAVALAALYAAIGVALRQRAHFRVLAQCHFVLAGGFATLAVPLALSARATAGLFAIEGAALIWLGLRQRHWLPQLTGVGLQALAAFSFVLGRVFASRDTVALANPTFTGALLVALAGFASAYCYERDKQSVPALALYLWGLSWWCGNALHEIGRFVTVVAQADALLAVAALSAWLAAEWQHRKPQPALAWTSAAAIATALPLALIQATAHATPFAGHGLWAWALFAALGLRSLFCLRSAMAGPALFAWLWVWPVAITLALMQAAENRSDSTAWAMMMLPGTLALGLTQYRPEALSWPLARDFPPIRPTLQLSYYLALGLLWLAGLRLPGGDASLWMPLLNPLGAMQGGLWLLALHWMYSGQADARIQALRSPLAAGALFLLLSTIVLRAAHHWGGIAWSPRMLSAGLVQTSLTILWSLLGMGCWILGSRRAQRALWLTGAVLMGAVLVKLVLVDRQHLGNLLGIASFIAYGLLCTAVGYFAPAPPRDRTPDEADSVGQVDIKSDQPSP